MLQGLDGVAHHVNVGVIDTPSRWMSESPSSKAAAPCRPSAFRATPMKPWGVQLASTLNRAGALKVFDRVQKRHLAVLVGVAPTVSRNRRTPR